MSLPFAWRADAQFEEAARWSEANRAGLAVAFVSEVQQVLDKIADQPD